MVIKDPFAYNKKLSMSDDLEFQAWFVDLGTSYHLTSFDSFLHNRLFDLGNDKVQIGNGQSLAIKSIDSYQPTSMSFT